MTVSLSLGRNCSGILHRKLLLTWGGLFGKKARNVLTVCQSWVTSTPTVITIICVHVRHFTFICYVFGRWRRTRVTSPQYSDISCNIFLNTFCCQGLLIDYNLFFGGVGFKKLFIALWLRLEAVNKTHDSQGPGVHLDQLDSRVHLLIHINLALRGPVQSKAGFLANWLNPNKEKWCCRSFPPPQIPCPR